MDISRRETYAMSKEEARRYREKGSSSLKTTPCGQKPHLTNLSCDVDEKVGEAGKRTGYGRKRLSWYLAQEKGERGLG